MTINESKTIDRIQHLTELHGAPGFEDDIKAYMKDQMTPFVDEFIENRMGGFLE